MMCVFLFIYVSEYTFSNRKNVSIINFEGDSGSKLDL